MSRTPRRLARFALMLALATTASSAAAQTTGGFASLRPALEARIARHHGRVGVGLLDPETREELTIRGDESFPTASVIKMGILIEVFTQVKEGNLSLEDPITLLAIDQKPGSGVLQFLSTPHQLTVHDAAFLMISQSDNTATNLLIDKVGLRAVNARMDELDFPGTAIFAEVFGRTATTISADSSAMFGLGVTTPREMTDLLGTIYRGEAVSPEASEQMVSMMRQQIWGIEQIPRYMPADVSVAHKNGSVNASRNDCAIVYSEARDYVLCVFTDENEDQSWRVDNEAHVLMADLARIVHRGLTGEAGG